MSAPDSSSGREAGREAEGVVEGVVEGVGAVWEAKAAPVDRCAAWRWAWRRQILPHLQQLELLPWHVESTLSPAHVLGRSGLQRIMRKREETHAAFRLCVCWQAVPMHRQSILALLCVSCLASLPKELQELQDLRASPTEHDSRDTIQEQQKEAQGWDQKLNLMAVYTVSAMINCA